MCHQARAAAGVTSLDRNGHRTDSSWGRISGGGKGSLGKRQRDSRCHRPLAADKTGMEETGGGKAEGGVGPAEGGAAGEADGKGVTLPDLGYL